VVAREPFEIGEIKSHELYSWQGHASDKTNNLESCIHMPSATKRRPWTRSDLAEFRRLAKQGLSGTAIAKKLKRSPGATYQRATSAGIRLNSKRIRRRK
jgi:hypothetical protein